MKKFLLFFIPVMFLLGAYSVSAEELLCDSFESVQYAETYIEEDIMPLSQGKTLAETLVEGWENLSQEINLAEYNIHKSDISETYTGILYDNPRLYYVGTKCRYLYNPATDMVVTVLPSYTEENTEVIAKTLEDIDKATEEILLCLDENMTVFEKIMTVHDYMVLNYEYDYTYSNFDITIMTTKKGVCMAYSMAFKHLMDQLDIECLYVTSSEAMNHGWNLVKIDGEWYHIDLTWDDPGSNFGQVRHTYALLSDDEIQHLDDPHYGYDLKGIEANSDKYDNAPWHEGIGSIVTINKIYYYEAGDALLDQSGKVIYEKLSGDGNWDVGGGYYFSDGNYTGLAEYNGLLYFNTDDAVYSYNPKKDEVTKILEYDGICGMYIDKNILKYYKLDVQNETFVEAGTYNLGKIRFGGTFHRNGQLVKRIYKAPDAEDFYVFALGKTGIYGKQLTDTGSLTISFDADDCRALFYWDSNLAPLTDKEVYD